MNLQANLRGVELSFNPEDEFKGTFFVKYSTYTNRITWAILVTAFTLLHALAGRGKPNYTVFRIVLAANIVGLAYFVFWSIFVLIEGYDDFVHASLVTKIYIGSIVAVYSGSTLAFTRIFFKYGRRPFGETKKEENYETLYGCDLKI
ncbi:unnamed protein product [Bursaphelenchus xylophilus]|uniref:(pine wood nematode) hypothetical protein n=1 Tax=Bursaphelenchus xylophilus TaxID=6326 RepID=A0A1I7RTW0_BURXY|nr:unnamed protein product [Bursaphelenchus xylophilus]CAG9132149.1 unnamed protein product [Bursaphelenchus xylophilus]